jgi:uncharacterized membrane protein YbhN (UPF0104 family)
MEMNDNKPATRTSSKGSGPGLLRTALGIVISLGCLVLLLWNLEWAQFWSTLQGADYWWLLPALLAVLIDVWIKVIKWQLLLLPTGKTSSINLLYSICVGYLVSTVLPGRLGELARIYFLARMERVSAIAVLSTVAVDRVLDVVAVALLLAIVLPTADLPAWVGQSGLLVGIGGVGLLGVSVAMAYPWGRSLFFKLLAILPNFPGKAIAEKWAEALCLGLEGLRGKGSFAKIVAATLAIWLINVFIFYFGMLSFHIQAPLWAAAMAVALTNLGMVVPSSPGYVGVYHYLVVLALGAYGVEREIALGYGVVMHLLWILPVGLIGAFALWRRGLTLMGWREGIESNDPAIDATQEARG